MTSVFCTSTRTADRGVDARQRFHRQHRVKEPGAGAALSFGDLDAHHPKLEQLVDELAGNLCLLVHLTDGGRISRSANSYTLSRNSASSSRRVVNPGCGVSLSHVVCCESEFNGHGRCSEQIAVSSSFRWYYRGKGGAHQE